MCSVRTHRSVGRADNRDASAGHRPPGRAGARLRRGRADAGPNAHAAAAARARGLTQAWRAPIAHLSLVDVRVPATRRATDASAGEVAVRDHQPVAGTECHRDRMEASAHHRREQTSRSSGRRVRRDRWQPPRFQPYASGGTARSVESPRSSRGGALRSPSPVSPPVARVGGSFGRLGPDRVSWRVRRDRSRVFAGSSLQELRRVSRDASSLRVSQLLEPPRTSKS